MVTRPEELHATLSAAYNAGDLEALLALYDDDAVFVIKPGKVTKGRDELRAAMQRLLDVRGKMRIDPRSFTRSGDVVLALGTFTLAGERRDGSPFQRTARFADILRRQPDGGWRIVVDNPFGGE